MLDLPIWDLAFSQFNTEQDCVIFSDLGLYTNRLSVKCKLALFTSLFSESLFEMSHCLTFSNAAYFKNFQIPSQTIVHWFSFQLSRSANK